MTKPTTLKDRQALLKHLNLSGKVCLELGVQHGHFSKDILACGPSTLHLVDPWKHFTDDSYPSWANLKSQAEQDAIYQSVLTRFSQHPQVHVHRSTSADAVQLFPPASLDFVYIDANHLMDYVIADLYLWYPRLKKGGWLTGHDYHQRRFPGLVKALGMFQRVTGETLSILTDQPEKGDKIPSWGICKTQRN